MKGLLLAPFGNEAVAGAIRRLRASGKVLVLMYHELADDEEADAWTVVRRTDFVCQMEHLRRSFDVVSLDEALRRMSGPRGPEVPTAVVTFDDGYSGNEKVLLPLVQRLEVPVTVFVSTGAVSEGGINWYDRIILALQDLGVRHLDLADLGLKAFHFPDGRGAKRWERVQGLLEALKALDPKRREEQVAAILERLPAPNAGQNDRLRPLTIEGVRHLAACPLVTIGAHSHCHNILVQIPLDEARSSVARSRRLLMEWTGRPVRHFAYPNGDHNQGVEAAVREEGFVSALATEERWWSGGDSAYAIPRIGIGRYDSIARFRAVTAGMPL